MGEIKNAKLLATGEPVKFRRKSKTSMELTLPQVPGAWDPNMHAVRRAPSDHVSVIVMQTDGNLTGLAKHPIIGTWTYQHAGKSYTREFTKDGTCLMKDGDAVGWTKAFCVVDDHTVLVEGGLTHVLTDQNSLNIESTFAGMRKAN